MFSSDDVFGVATAFNQDLCAWGTKLQKTANVGDMFSGSGCENKADPILNDEPPGPFCADCGTVFV
jgi:hypothetical protein